MIKELNLVNSDLILNSTRLLILLSKFESRKAFKMNINKIMLYDFYMKFPKTMIPSVNKDIKVHDFNEFYSFYHWQPDRNQYHQFIRYLLSKKLIDKKILSNDFIYQINDRGKNVIERLESDYSKQLDTISDYIKQEVSKLSDAKIEENILENAFNIK
ncbi:hypothetical protein P4601_16130 [Peribacillus frigoritolerans]|uniref:ABC-three component system middle component 2 n=1 Tax=Peribacillus frigoritolerans TaxID=450367 RepID=UPI002E1E3EF3|nr:hypothetical protein [Peribacillus frigoritolerans]